MRHLISDIDGEANAISGGESLSNHRAIRNRCYLEGFSVISEDII